MACLKVTVTEVFALVKSLTTNLVNPVKETLIFLKLVALQINEIRIITTNPK